VGGQGMCTMVEPFQRFRHVAEAVTSPSKHNGAGCMNPMGISLNNYKIKCINV